MLLNRIWLVCTLLAALAATGCRPQTPATLHCTVDDEALHLLPAIHVTLRKLPSGPTSSVQTDQGGAFEARLAPGRYSVSVTDAPGYAPVERHTELDPGEIQWMAIRLEHAPSP